MVAVPVEPFAPLMVMVALAIGAPVAAVPVILTVAVGVALFGVLELLLLLQPASMTADNMAATKILDTETKEQLFKIFSPESFFE